MWHTSDAVFYSWPATKWPASATAGLQSDCARNPWCGYVTKVWQCLMCKIPDYKSAVQSLNSIPPQTHRSCILHWCQPHVAALKHQQSCVSQPVSKHRSAFLLQTSCFGLYVKNLFRRDGEVVLGEIQFPFMQYIRCSYSQGPQWQRFTAHKYVFTFRPKWWVIAVAVCTVAMDVETTVKGAFV